MKPNDLISTYTRIANALIDRFLEFNTTKLLTLIIAVTCAVTTSFGQLNIAATGTNYTIDFESTVADVNNGVFAGAGWEQSPTAGQLDSDAWEYTGMSSGADAARGTASFGVTTGGWYSFNHLGGRALGCQPGGSDWTPGTLTLRIQNNTGSVVTTLNVDYDIVCNNDQDRGNTFNFSHSLDDATYSPEAGLNYTSPAALTNTIIVAPRSIEITGLTIPDGAYYYLRWTGSDANGGGSRDEFAIDNIVLSTSDPVDEDEDDDGFTVDDGDCDDTNAAINPGADEICDGIDNNCDGFIDEGLTSTFYADTDGDGYGDPNNSVQACSAPAGFITDNNDCDDSDATINPSAIEICDGIDNDCDGDIDSADSDYVDNEAPVLTLPADVLALACGSDETSAGTGVASAIDACGGFVTITQTDAVSTVSAGPEFPLIISAVFDGPLSGGVPKGVELYVGEDIADLSIYGIGSANNGGGTDGQEFTFPAVSATAGDLIYVASEATGFTSWFGFAPDYTSSALAINGDDAIELFKSGAVIDVFGDINVDGTGQPWEYQDGWAYRNNGTEPGGASFTLASWSFSGINALDGESDNATAATPIPIGTYTAPSGGEDLCGNTKVITRTWTAEDASGNAVSADQIITVIDNTAPTIDVEASNLTVECDGMGNTAAFAAWLASNGTTGDASDACSIVVTWTNSSTGLNDLCGATGAETVTFTATDECGNSSTTSATFTIEDSTPPVLTLPADVIALDCGSDESSATNGVATGLDACGSVTISESDVVFTGGGGISSFAIQSFETSGDNWTPTFSTPACTNGSDRWDYSTSLNAIGPNDGAQFWGIEDLNGNCGGAGFETISLPDFDVSPYISNVFSFDYNAVGFDNGDDIKYELFYDNVSQGEVLVVDGNSNFSTNGWETETVIIPEAVNNVNVIISIKQNGGSDYGGIDNIKLTGESSSEPLCGNTKVITRTWTATDDCGNSTSGDQIITVVDTAPPSITAPADVTIECTTDESSAATGVATGFDTCGGVVITESSTEVAGCGNTKVITRTWTATDDCGNASSVDQTIIVVDTTPPSITAPADATIECTTDESSAATGAATGSDTCGGVVITESSTAVAGCGNTKVITRTWTATDDCGNASSVDQTIIVVDTTPPSITAPADATIECSTDESSAATGVATGSDTCGGVVITESSAEVAGCGNTKVITRTWTATDDCGNSTSADQTITVIDETGPALTCPVDIATCADPLMITGSAVYWTVPAPTDDCGAIAMLVSDYQSGDIFPVGTTTVTYSAIDDCGNTSECSFEIEVYEAPEVYITESEQSIYCQANTKILTANTNTNVGGITYAWSNGDTDVQTQVAVTGTYSVTVTDSNGCTQETSYDVVVDAENLVSAYTIIAEKEVHLHNDNIVLNGGVGASNSNGKVKIHHDSFVTGSTTFAKADEIDVNNGSAVTTQILSPATVTLPDFLYNPYDSNDDITVNDGQTIVLSDQVYGKIDVKKNATVIFTEKDVYIEDLHVKDNATVTFEQCAFVRINKKLHFHKNATVNGLGDQVWLFVDDKVDIHEGATIHASIYATGHEIKVKGKDNNPSSMIGQFIAEKVKGDKSVTWDWNSNCNSLCAPEVIPAAMIASDNDGNTEGTGLVAILSEEKKEVIANHGGAMTEFTIWPNPTNGQATLMIIPVSNERVRIELYSMDGSLVSAIFEGEVMKGVSHTEHLDMSKYENGIYFIRIVQNDKVQTKKIVFTR